MATEYTFGTGGSYATLTAAITAAATNLRNGFDIDFLQVGNSNETISPSLTPHGRATGTQIVRVINTSPHNGNPNTGFTITLNNTQIAMWYDIAGGIWAVAHAFPKEIFLNDRTSPSGYSRDIDLNWEFYKLILSGRVEPETISILMSQSIAVGRTR